MNDIKLHSVTQTENFIKKGKAIVEDIELSLKDKNPNLLYVRFEIVLNLTDNSHAVHKSDYVWKNIPFKISAQLIGTDDFEILCSIVQTSLGQARIMFLNENVH